MKNSFDVIVIGGGHAGCEAAAAAARMGANTALITLKPDNIGEMSCNPSIGGIGKGHLVREVDAMDGLIARTGDKAAIHYRLLNRRKGPAVRGVRAQICRNTYKKYMNQHLKELQNLSIIFRSIIDIKPEKINLVKVTSEEGEIFKCKNIIITTGTFLNGYIRIGKSKKSAGRKNEAASVKLANSIKKLNLKTARLSTGTPPRLDGNTINWAKTIVQKTDPIPEYLSFQTEKTFQKQISCYISFTNEKAMQVINDNMHQSAKFNTKEKLPNPRYCPSIEDKAIKFPQQKNHQIFLEPESLFNNIIYPSGISISMPPEIQLEFLREIDGLENVVMFQPGYQIEYDYIEPRQLNYDLSCKKYPQIFLAGQVNGTTGYEEAAAQGIVAGLNAALKASQQKTIAISRSEAYIGVMIDDLITKGVSEPYRMFTSRAEFRLSLSYDDADQRLTPIAEKIGLAGENITKIAKNNNFQIQSIINQLKSKIYTPEQIKQKCPTINIAQDGKKRNLLTWLARPQFNIDELQLFYPQIKNYDCKITNRIEAIALYKPYLEKQQQDIQKLKIDEQFQIPKNTIYQNINGLNNEIKEKLQKINPYNISQASRIEGMTPVALLMLIAYVKKIDATKQM